MVPIPDHVFSSLIDTELIYENAPSGYVSILVDGTIIKLNKTLLTWLGYAQEEILFKMKLSDFLSKGGNIHYEMFFRPMITINGNIKELNYELVKKDGTRFPALINGTSIYDGAGKVLAVNIVVTDITQRNAYEKELLKAKQLLNEQKEGFELLADASPEMIWTANHKSQINYVNKKAAEYFNLPVSEITKPLILSQIHAGDKFKLIKKWLKENKLEKEFKGVFRLTNNQKDYEWFEATIKPLYKSKTDIKWLGTCISVQEHMLAMQRKDEFIDMASHELKTPITILQGYLQMITMRAVSDEILLYANKSLLALKNFQFIISSLLNVSVINSGKLSLNFSKFSMNELLNECVGNLQNAVKSHQLKKEIYDDEVFVNADREKIMQVIINLLNNAIKYSPVSSTIIVKMVRDKPNNNCGISIIDFGEGISENDYEKIFDKYYQAENNRTKAGLGLGLYITRNILTAHNTTLEVSSKVGKGSVFYFTLSCNKKEATM